MAAVSRPSASSTTASGLPAKRRVVNTSSVVKRRATCDSPIDVVTEGAALKPIDQPGLDQEPVEAACLGPAGAIIEQALAALEDAFLLGERGIERKPGRLLHHQRQIRRI